MGDSAFFLALLPGSFELSPDVGKAPGASHSIGWSSTSLFPTPHPAGQFTAAITLEDAAKVLRDDRFGFHRLLGQAPVVNHVGAGHRGHPHLTRSGRAILGLRSKKADRRLVHLHVSASPHLLVHVADDDINLAGAEADVIAQGRQGQVHAVFPKKGLALPVERQVRQELV